MLGPANPQPKATQEEIRSSKDSAEKTPLSHYDGIDTSYDENQDESGYDIFRRPENVRQMQSASFLVFAVLLRSHAPE